MPERGVGDFIHRREQQRPCAYRYFGDLHSAKVVILITNYELRITEEHGRKDGLFYFFKKKKNAAKEKIDYRELPISLRELPERYFFEKRKIK
jgi:hypothetical protein